MSFLIWLEETAIATWVREGGSLLGYPTILFLHTLTLATVAGLNAGISLRLLGFADKLPLASLTRFFPVIWWVFAVTAASGLALLVADATTKMMSPVFYIKMVFVGLALYTLHLMKTRVFRAPYLEGARLPSNAWLLAIASIVLWIAATTAGRLMAYLGPVSGLF